MDKFLNETLFDSDIKKKEKRAKTRKYKGHLINYCFNDGFNSILISIGNKEDVCLTVIDLPIGDQLTAEDLKKTKRAILRRIKEEKIVSKIYNLRKEGEKCFQEGLAIINFMRAQQHPIFYQKMVKDMIEEKDLNGLKRLRERITDYLKEEQKDESLPVEEFEGSLKTIIQNEESCQYF